MPVLRSNTIFADRYVLKEHLGSSDVSEVWKVEDRFLENSVLAIKIFSPGKALSEDEIDVFRNEFTVLLPFDHPHLLKPRHFDTFEGRPYLVMPFCKGGNLLQHLEQKESGLSERMIAQIMDQVGSALAYFHSRGMVHQSIKPDNILIGGRGRFLLADFGASIKVRGTNGRRVHQSTRPPAQFLSSNASRYAAPEAFHEKRPSKKSDMFSFGIMLYELAAKGTPYKNLGERLLKGKDLEIPVLPSPYSRELSYLLIACMSHEPWNRPSAKELSDLAAEYLKNDLGMWSVNVSLTDRKGHILNADSFQAISSRHTLKLTPHPVDPVQMPTVGNVKVETGPMVYETIQPGSPDTSPPAESEESESRSPIRPSSERPKNEIRPRFTEGPSFFSPIRKKIALVWHRLKGM